MSMSCIPRAWPKPQTTYHVPKHSPQSIPKLYSYRYTVHVYFLGCIIYPTTKLPMVGECNQADNKLTLNITSISRISKLRVKARLGLPRFWQFLAWGLSTSCEIIKYYPCIFPGSEEYSILLNKIWIPRVIYPCTEYGAMGLENTLRMVVSHSWALELRHGD